MSNKSKRKSSARRSHGRGGSKPFAKHDPNEVATVINEGLDRSTRLDAVELSQLAKALGQRFPSVLRWRRGISNKTLSGDPIPWYPLASRPDPRQPKPSQTVAFHQGDFYLQDAGSLLALALCQADRDALLGQHVCDLCAAPGGKASALLEAVGPHGFLLANEAIQSRVAPLAFNLSRTGSNRFAIAQQDPEQIAKRWGNTFDLVLVDAPCSGQTLLSRDKQTAGALQENHITLNAQRQRRILVAAIQLLRPGGSLVYSTCTFATAENEDQVRWLVDEHSLLPYPLPALEDYRSSDLDGCYRLWPHRHQCAGSFAARLTKPLDQATSTEVTTTDRFKAKPNRSELSLFDQLNADFPFLAGSTSGESHFRLDDWLLYEEPLGAPDWIQEYDLILPELAHRSGSTWKPSHAAALRRGEAALPAPLIAVDEELARKYLRGETIPTDNAGWQIVTHQDRPLGWIKSDGRIGKNHLPRHARVTHSLSSGAVS